MARRPDFRFPEIKQRAGVDPNVSDGALRRLETQKNVFEQLGGLYEQRRRQIEKYRGQKEEREVRREAQREGTQAGLMAARNDQPAQKVVDVTFEKGPDVGHSATVRHTLPVGVDPKSIFGEDVSVEVIEERTQNFKPSDLNLPEGVSVYDNVFRSNAISAFVSQTQIGARRQAQQIFEENPNDPGGFAEEFDGLTEGIRQGLPAQARPKFNQSVDRIRSHYMSKARQNQKKVARSSALEKAMPEIEQRRNHILDMARHSQGDPGGIQDLTEELAEMKDRLAQMGPSGTEFAIEGTSYPSRGNRLGHLTPQQMGKLFRSVRQRAEELMVVGQYDRIDNIEGKRDFVANFVHDIKFPEEENRLNVDVTELLSDEQQNRVLSEMQQDIGQKKNLQKQEHQFRLNEVKDRLQTLKGGGTISEGQMSEDLSFLSETLQGPLAGSDEAHNTWLDYKRERIVGAYRQKLHQMSELQLQREEQALEGIVGSEELEDENLVNMQLEEVRKRQNEFERRAAQDPLEFARESGVVDFEQLQFDQMPSIPEEATDEEVQQKLEQRRQATRELTQQLRQRQSISDQVADWTGQPKRIFTDVEKERLHNHLKTATADQKIALGIGMVRALDQDHAYRALHEISSSNGVFAQSVGIANKGFPHFPAARSALRGEQLLKENESLLMPENVDLRSKWVEFVGGAFEHMPSTEIDVFRTAKAIYADKIRGTQDEGTWMPDTWTESIRLATGGFERTEGVWEGGATRNFRGQSIILPEGMTTDKLDGVLNTLDEIDVEKESNDPMVRLSVGQVPPRWENGDRFTADDLQDEDIQLRWAGNNKYFLFDTITQGYVKGGGKNGRYEMDLSPLVGLDLKADAPFSVTRFLLGSRSTLEAPDDPSKTTPRIVADKLGIPPENVAEELGTEDLDQPVAKRDLVEFEQKTSERAPTGRKPGGPTPIFNNAPDGDDSIDAMRRRMHEDFTRERLSEETGQIPEELSLEETAPEEPGAGAFEDLEEPVEIRRPHSLSGSGTSEPVEAPEPIESTQAHRGGAAGDTLAERNNNPGNLKFAGQKNATEGEGGFAKFPSKRAGFNALVRQINLDKGRGHHIKSFLETYAPPFAVVGPEGDVVKTFKSRVEADIWRRDNAESASVKQINDTQSYIDFITDRLDATGTTHLQDLDTHALARSMTAFETGKEFREFMD